MSKQLERLRNSGSQIFLGFLLAMALVAVIEAATTYDEECGWGWAGAGWDTHVSADSGGVRLIHVGRGRCRLKVRFQGDVELSADDSRIERLGPGAYLEIDERRNGERRRLEVRPDDAGNPEYAYFVDRRPGEFDDAAREWFLAVLPRFYRSTGVDAEQRVARLLASAGLDGVLDEIGRIPGDHVQGLYLRSLVAREELEPEDVEKVLRAAGQEVASDYELAKVLAGISATRLETAALRDAYVTAAETIGSDFELRRLLTALVESGGLDAGATDAVLGAALSIASDHELAELLVRVAEGHPPGRELPPRYAEALLQVGSDFEHKRALVAALDHTLAGGGDPGEALDRLLRTAARIGSDYELAEVLVFLAGAFPGAVALPASCFELLGSIGSDHEERRALSAIVERPELSESALREVLAASLSIGSDFEQAELLLLVAERHPIPETLRPDFEHAAAGIGSQVQRQRVEEAAERAFRRPRPRASESESTALLPIDIDRLI